MVGTIVQISCKETLQRILLLLSPKLSELFLSKTDQFSKLKKTRKSRYIDRDSEPQVKFQDFKSHSTFSLVNSLIFKDSIKDKQKAAYKLTLSKVF